MRWKLSKPGSTKAVKFLLDNIKNFKKTDFFKLGHL